MLTTSYYTTSIFVFFITVQITKLKSFKELPSISHFDVTLRNAKFHFLGGKHLAVIKSSQEKKQVSTCSTLMICMTLKKGNNSLGVIEKLVFFSLKPFSQES